RSFNLKDCANKSEMEEPRVAWSHVLWPPPLNEGLLRKVAPIFDADEFLSRCAPGYSCLPQALHGLHVRGVRLGLRRVCSSKTGASRAQSRIGIQQDFTPQGQASRTATAVG